MGCRVEPPAIRGCAFIGPHSHSSEILHGDDVHHALVVRKAVAQGFFLGEGFGSCNGLKKKMFDFLHARNVLAVQQDDWRVAGCVVS